MHPDSIPPRYLVDTVWFPRINLGNFTSSFDAFFRDRPGNNYVCVYSVHTTVECRRDVRLRAIQNASFLTIADGQPVGA